MTSRKTAPDGPVHEFFGLSYSNYLVLHRTLMQSMSLEWQERMVACLQELNQAFDHVERVGTFLVQPATERCYSELSELEMSRLGVTAVWEGRGAYRHQVFYDADHVEHDPDDWLVVPYGEDPVPHYNRGRTYIEPHE
jgi:GAF domain-containing protein